MKLKYKWFIELSVALNVILLTLIGINHVKADLAHKDFFINEILEPLMILEGMIRHQIENGWEQPYLVSVKLEEIVINLNKVQQMSYFSSWLNKEEVQSITTLYNVLIEYPHYSFHDLVPLEEEERFKYEQLQEKLSEMGWTYRGYIDRDWKQFIPQVQQFVTLLQQNAS